jgi:hypothetical protein
MRNNKRKLLLAVLVFLGLYLTTVSTVSADPVIESVITAPEHPKPLSTFTVIADISGENIISVKVTISECTDGPPEQCFIGHTNLPMSLRDGKYEAKVTLTGTQDSIDHVQYMFYINDDGTYYNLTGRTNLDTGTGNGGDNGGGNSSPGFEIISVILAVIIGVAIYKKKR